MQNGYYSQNYQNFPVQSHSLPFQYYNPSHTITNAYPISSPQTINQPIPRIYETLNKPLFTIPAFRGASFSPNSHLIPIKTQVMPNPSYNIQGQPHYISAKLINQ